eukprot:s307_g10.t1
MPFVPSGLRKGDRKSLKLAWTLGQNRTGHCRCSRPAATLAWSFEIGVSTELQFPAQAWDIRGSLQTLCCRPRPTPAQAVVHPDPDGCLFESAAEESAWQYFCLDNLLLALQSRF